MTNSSLFSGFLSIILVWLFINLSLESSEGKTSVHNNQIVYEIQKVQIENIRKTISRLQNIGNRMTWANQWKTARWIKMELGRLGLKVQIDEYEYNGKIWPNVLAELEGHEKNDEIIMIIAHLDSISNDPDKHAPGADDNGTGVAVIMELARILKDISMNRTVQFAVFSNEEQGTAGSKDFVRKAIRKEMKIKAVLNIDLLGYNLQKIPFEMSAVNAHKGLKHKISAIYKMFRNYLYGLKKGPNILEVAGRYRNTRLVRETSKWIRTYSDLKVEENIGDDCG